MKYENKVEVDFFHFNIHNFLFFKYIYLKILLNTFVTTVLMIKIKVMVGLPNKVLIWAFELFVEKKHCNIHHWLCMNRIS